MPPRRETDSNAASAGKTSRALHPRERATLPGVEENQDVVGQRARLELHAPAAAREAHAPASSSGRAGSRASEPTTMAACADRKGHDHGEARSGGTGIARAPEAPWERRHRAKGPVGENELPGAGVARRRRIRRRRASRNEASVLKQRFGREKGRPPVTDSRPKRIPSAPVRVVPPRDVRPGLVRIERQQKPARPAARTAAESTSSRPSRQCRALTMSGSAESSAAEMSARSKRVPARSPRAGGPPSRPRAGREDRRRSHERTNADPRATARDQEMR